MTSEFEQVSNVLALLEDWYLAQCDGDWEHTFGVRISTLDNPGWSVVVDLSETDMEGKPFEGVEIERAEHDWVHCTLDGNVFRGAGGPRNLGEILRIFLNWAGMLPRDGDA